jgi:beta-galactosidase
LSTKATTARQRHQNDAADDPYLTKRYDLLHSTPMQRKLRRLAPMPIGCVFIQWPEMGEADIRAHFQTMKELGFTCLKGILCCPGTSVAKVQNLAMDEGLVPWWYDRGGWADITPHLLERLGLPRDMEMAAAVAHPKMVAYQEQLLRRRILRQEASRQTPKEKRQANVFLPGEPDPDPTAVPGTNVVAKGACLPERDLSRFVEWLKTRYNDVSALKHAWTCDSSSHSRAAAAWKTWEDVAAGVAHYPSREFRHLRDIMRFKADMRLERLREAVDRAHAEDPDEPLRAGGEISIFLPHVASGIDMEGYAEIMADGGCFYPSMHPGWHLEEVEYELVRPTYMQASMCVDWAKGVWSAPIESSGGPQWWSGGGKVPFVPEVKPLQPGFTFNEHTMEQLIFSYLGAGFKGFGLWCWNPREASWEAGEYALCDRNNAVTPRARRVGEIGKAMQRYARELWAAHKEPLVGLYQEWENDAMWAALAVSGRDRYRMDPVKARIGAARALINANVPWEHVTQRQLEKGLAPRYATIYLPAAMCLSARLTRLLSDFVRQGGRVVMDMPGAWLDERARLVDTRQGSAFEELFGAILHEYAYCNNEPFSIGKTQLKGFAAVLTPTTARVVAKYGNGAPAITENKLGAGAAVLLGAEASSACLKPGNDDVESLLVKTALGGRQPPYACQGAIVYRIAAPTADHYFLINDGPATAVTLDTKAFRYRSVRDAVSGEKVAGRIALPPHGGRWLRMEKA